MQLQELKGIGDKTAKSFEKLNIHRVEDLITYFPRRYDRFEAPVLLKEIGNSGIYAVECILRGSPKNFKTAKGKEMLTATACDREGDVINLTWFNMAFLAKQLKPGIRYIMRGEVTHEGRFLTMTQPGIYTNIDYEILTKRLQPVYPLKAGISNKTLQKAIKQALVERELMKETLSPFILEKYELLDRQNALCDIHFPCSDEDMYKARRRLIFDEFYTFLMALKKLKEEKVYEMNHYVINRDSRTEEFIEKLPFKLTADQMNVYTSIMDDVSGMHICNRLVQGDVGSGKTIVAILAMMNAAYAGYQSALMVPTEVLATQHYETITGLFEKYDIDIHVELLTGSVTAAKKRAVKEQIKTGYAKIVIGTHAILEDNVEFDCLALAITDEQHRFGVRQREKLQNKNTYPHVCVMSATPIPRTLAIILYGDLDISIISTMPQNRLPIKTCIINERMRNKSYKFILDEIAKKHQAYVICPMVEDSEDSDAENVIDYARTLSDNLGENVRVEYLHGKMKPAEKNEIMERFSSGVTDVLVSTTVIEVGINVPNATVIMIENADRFGLAQLHQLRGRVGRGEYQSYCILVDSKENEKSKERLGVLFKSNDGFFIANEDLKTRGPGDFFGVRQSGEILFNLGDIYNDSDILLKAKEAVELS